MDDKNIERQILNVMNQVRDQVSYQVQDQALRHRDLIKDQMREK